MLRPLHMLVLTMAILSGACCGPSTDPTDPECGTEDLAADAQLVVGSSGPRCDPCSIDAELFVAATLSTECGPVEWQLPSTCLVGAVRATRPSDGEVFALETRNCGSAFTDRSVTPEEPLTVREPSVSQVFDGEPIVPGDYVFEVEFPQMLEIEPATFSVTLASP